VPTEIKYNILATKTNIDASKEANNIMGESGKDCHLSYS
jgi:hypothetical protein